MRRLLAGLLDVLIRWVDESVSAIELQKRLLQAFSIALADYRQQGSNYSLRAAGDLAGTACDLKKAGLINVVPAELQRMQDTHTADVEQARAWRGILPEGKVLIKSAFAADSGEMLNALDEVGNKEEKAFVSAALETLLRHVEVKRKKCLALTLTESTARNLFMERQRVIWLFCRAAIRRSDYRLLNAALKLNDWSLKVLNPRRQTTDEHCAQLRALAAAEAAAKEMLT